MEDFLYIFRHKVLTRESISAIISANVKDRGASCQEYVGRKSPPQGLSVGKGRLPKGTEAKGIPGRTENIPATVAVLRSAIGIKASGIFLLSFIITAHKTRL